MGTELIDVFFQLGTRLQNAMRAGDHQAARQVIDFCLWGLRHPELQEPFLYNTEYFFDPVLQSEDWRLMLWTLLSDAEFAYLMRFFAQGTVRHKWLEDDLEREFRFRPKARKS